MKPFRLLLVLTTVVGTSAAVASEVKPTDPHIRYVGRFDYHDAAGPRCAWPASTVEIAFRGSALKAKIRDGGKDRFEVIVDGTPTQVLKLQQGTLEYTVASNLSTGSHLVQLVKRTETFTGASQFLGFDVTGTLLTPKKPKHIIEVIGDSISCGYGNEGKVKEEHFSNETENAYMTYGAIAARALKADLVDIAWSGRKMWPDNSIPEIYDLAIADIRTTTWDLKQQTPDVFVINLATNDFGKANPDEKGWTSAYSAFIDRLRKRSPNATVYCALGPMMTDNWPPKNQALTTLRKYIQKVVALRASVGDHKIKVIEFETQNEQRDGIGSDWHPNIKTHQNMAARLVQAIRADLGW